MTCVLSLTGLSFYFKASRDEFPVFWSRSTPPPIQLDNKKLKGGLGGFFNPVVFPLQWLGEYPNT